MRRVDFIAGIVLVILAFFLVSDLFFHPGRSVTFDGHVHITTIDQFYQALKSGEFPARWADGFTNYGHPLPLVAQQTTSYLGAFFQIFTQNPVTAYNLVMFTGAAVSALLLYRFLRYYVSETSAFLGAGLFMFAPYRITNIYVRGAIPEFLAAAFVPLALIGLYQTVQQKKWLGLFLVGASVAGLALTHPMMLVISSLVLVPYALYLLWPLHRNIRSIVWLGGAGVAGIGASSYYVLPLLLELKYFNYGSLSDRFRGPTNFLSWQNYAFESWQYYSATHPGPRDQLLALGIFEAAILAVVLGVVARLLWQKKIIGRFALPWLVTAGLSVFLMSPWSEPVYRHVSLWNNLQYPWRNLAALMFVVPILFAWVLERLRWPWVGAGILILVAIYRFPQLYGKNFLLYDLSHYQATSANLHTANMSTIWMGDVREYPLQANQAEVIFGTGTLTPTLQKNSVRRYQVSAETPVRVVDYTFFFPGWRVKIDGQEVAIQFQDPAYRGVITYEVPAGDHAVEVRFGDTKIRLLAKLVSLTTGVAVVGVAGLRRALESRGLGLK